MNARQLLAISLVGIAAAAPLAPAQAKPKEIKKSWSMTLAPFPVPAQGTPTCLPADGREGVTKHTETLKAPAAGVLKAELTGFYGDWDITVFDAKDKALGAGGGTSTPNTSPAVGTDKITVKIKKAGTYKVVMCNFAGSPAATGKYSFVYGK